MEVIDNFLDNYRFEALQNVMMGPTFDWYYNSGINEMSEPHQYQFTHLFTSRSDSPQKSIYYDLVEPCFNRLLVKDIFRVKANLNPRTVFNRNTGYHVDGAIRGPHTTSILYMNTNNGGTIFKGKEKVDCVANRMVIFDSNIPHAGITCTDEKIKVVVNFNYSETSKL